ncbi:MAG: hypothetical protein KDK45_25205 [Leptospiraceae bacterium]|nr:hypothetical protein [Leptospiraceae bacterium]
MKYEDKEILSENAKAIRYGIMQIYVNGIKTNRIYEIEIEDENSKKLRISFQSVRMFGKNKDMEETYFSIIEALWESVTYKLFKKNLDALYEGKSVKLASVEISPSGLKMSVRRWFKKEEHFVEWKDLRKSVGEGYLNIQSSVNKKVKLSLQLQKQWNAVVLSAILDYLWEEGRAYQLDEMHRRF